MLPEQFQIGAVFPQTELGGDPGAVRAWVQAVTDLGYGHIAVFDHVIGADPRVHAGWDRPYTVDTTFHEILVLFGFIAALTRLELVSSVVILPQRQTVLVAKQAAELDLLTEGRFRLGVGIGWNAVEFEALGQRFGAALRQGSPALGQRFGAALGQGLSSPPRQRLRVALR